jgi:hypothetical protein
MFFFYYLIKNVVKTFFKEYFNEKMLYNIFFVILIKML